MGNYGCSTCCSEKHIEKNEEVLTHKKTISMEVTKDKTELA